MYVTRILCVRCYVYVIRIPFVSGFVCILQACCVWSFVYVICILYVKVLSVCIRYSLYVKSLSVYHRYSLCEGLFYPCVKVFCLYHVFSV